MSKYCAEDLRNAAEDVENFSGYDEDIIADMLRFAADVLGREKKYEYASVLPDGSMSCAHDDVMEAGYHAFRREVGEWEEV